MNIEKYIIRRSTPADYPQIAKLMDRVFKPQSFEKRVKLWNWRYEANPAKSQDMPNFLVADHNGVILGFHGQIPMRLKVEESVLCVSCSCDLSADPKARALGMKIKIKALSKETSPIQISTSANEAGNRITLALGGYEVEVGRKKMIKPTKVNRLIQIKLRGKVGNVLAKLGGIILGYPANVIIAIARLIDSYKYIKNAEIKTIERFDHRFDQLWQRVSKNYKIIIVRDSAYLNWRYTNYPLRKINCFGLFKDDSPLGFAVLYNSIDEDGLPFSALLELFGPDNEEMIYEHLLSEVVKRALGAGSHYITAKTNVPRLEKTLKRHGFHMRALPYSPITYKNNTEIPLELFKNSHNWYISLGDGDICYYYD